MKPHPAKSFTTGKRNCPKSTSDTARQALEWNPRGESKEGSTSENLEEVTGRGAQIKEARTTTKRTAANRVRCNRSLFHQERNSLTFLNNECLLQRETLPDFGGFLTSDRLERKFTVVSR